MVYYIHFDFGASLRKLLQISLHSYNDVPTSLVVHPNNRNDVRRLLDDLNLSDVDVKMLAGCLRPEIRMQISEGNAV